MAGGSESAKITQLLIEWNNGRNGALQDLLPLVYGELRRLEEVISGEPVQYGPGFFGRDCHGRKAIGIVVSIHRVAVPAESGLNFHLVAATTTESRMFD